jgi:CspA family cold shock protein
LRAAHSGIPKLSEDLSLKIRLEKAKTAMTIGSVKFFDTAKGFGFIVPDVGGQDVFVDKAAVRSAGMSALEKGQRFSYELVQDTKGASKAIKLESVAAPMAAGSAENYSRGYAGQAEGGVASGRSSFAARRGGKRDPTSGKTVSQLAECQRKYEFYSDLGRDAFNDPVAREGYLQHAEHFYRVMNEAITRQCDEK